MNRIVCQITFARAALITGLVSLTASVGLAEPGLLLVAHGSPSRQWNQPVVEFGRRVGREAVANGPFKAARTAMLEFCEPSVPMAIAQLESEGCDSVIVVPLFIGPSGHSLFDVPTVLGTFYSPRIAAAIAEEGRNVARPRVPVRMTETLCSSELLERFALDQACKLSQKPAEEALVLLAHGDENHRGILDRLMRRITTYCCGQAGIDYGDWAYVGVGQEYVGKGVEAIERAFQRKRRVLVVGIYVSLSAQRLHARALAKIQRNKPDSVLFAGKDVIFSDQAVIGHPKATRCVVDMAKQAVE